MDDNLNGIMNLDFNEEAASHTKYMMYSQNALEEGLPNVASLFRNLAGQEMAHARMWGERLGEIGDTEQNLRRAADDEMADSEKYAQQYAQYKDPVMKALSDVEKRHEKELRTTLEALENGTAFDMPSVVTWECTNCGLRTMDRQPPSVCPLCRSSQGNFRMI